MTDPVSGELKGHLCGRASLGLPCRREMHTVDQWSLPVNADGPLVRAINLPAVAAGAWQQLTFNCALVNKESVILCSAGINMETALGSSAIACPLLAVGPITAGQTFVVYVSNPFSQPIEAGWWIDVQIVNPCC
jgi:hypothetical protein